MHAQNNTATGLPLFPACFFMSWGAPQFVAILAVSSLLDYIFGKSLVPYGLHEKRRQKLMVFAIGLNVVVLAYFKYMNFFVNQIFWVMDALDRQHEPWVAIALPIGISFFTFQKISYLVDIYRGIVRPATSFHNYFLYVSLFPQLIAGPIVRYHDISQQLISRNFDTEIFCRDFGDLPQGWEKKYLLQTPWVKLQTMPLPWHLPIFVHQLPGWVPFAILFRYILISPGILIWP